RRRLRLWLRGASVSPVTVGELNTEASVEPSSPQRGAGPPAAASWVELERLRTAAAELAGLRDRTRAEGFDD
ncbi:MAG: hypothetical protein QOG42_1130, partial [Solirubrobacteraceae bacterium]|nr:hypothetical protein [Solirubrobacteraceae bacterium]